VKSLISLPKQVALVKKVGWQVFMTKLDERRLEKANAFMRIAV